MMYHYSYYSGEVMSKVMSKKIATVLTLLLSLCLIFYGCKSKPEVEDESPVEEVSPSMSEDEMLVTARYNIEQAEKFKSEIDESGYDYDVQSYQNALDALQQAKNALGNDENPPDAIVAYEKSAEASKLFEDLAKKIRAQKEADEEAARLAQLEKEKAQAAQQALKDAEDRKTKIENENLVEFDSESYEKGNALLEEAQKLAENGATSDEILAKAKEANDAYIAVLNAAYEQKARDCKVSVDEARNKCLEIKADRADKKNFDAAQLQYISAEDAFVQKDYEKSYAFYEKALPAFTKIYEVVKEKKSRADAAIERAKNKSAESEQFAQEADEIAPLPEDAEGFESEDFESETVEVVGAEPEDLESESVEPENPESSTTEEQGDIE